MQINYNEVYCDQKSKESFINGIVQIILSDGILEEVELSALKFLIKTLEFDSKLDIDNLIGNAKSKNIEFKNKIQQVVFLKEAIQISMLDSDYHESERKSILEFSRQFEIEIEMVEKLESWCKAGIEWFLQGEEIFNLTVLEK